MKNREKFKDELIESCMKERQGEFFNKYIRPYYNCDEWECISDEVSTVLTAIWLDEEYQQQEVDWSKVENDDPILVRDGDDEEWNRAHFAYYKNGKVYAWSGGKTSWTASSYMHWEYAKLAEPQE